MRGKHQQEDAKATDGYSISSAGPGKLSLEAVAVLRDRHRYINSPRRADRAIRANFQRCPPAQPRGLPDENGTARLCGEPEMEPQVGSFLLGRHFRPDPAVLPDARAAVLVADRARYRRHLDVL